MSSKSFLVARREYLENVRTKGFWIGVLIVPILMCAMFIVPSWLEGKKETRTYAVVDHSGWMLQAIEERAAMPDFEAVLEHALHLMRDDPKAFERLSREMQLLIRALDKSIDDPAVASALGESSHDDESKEDPTQARKRREDKVIASTAVVLSLSESDLEDVPVPALMKEGMKAMFREVIPLRDAIREWWEKLPPSEAREFSNSVSKAMFRRVDVDAADGNLIETLNKKIGADELFAYFVIGEDPVEKGDACRYVANNLTDSSLLDWFKRNANQVVREKRLDAKKIDKATAQWIQAPLEFESRKIGAGGKEEEVSKEAVLRSWAPLAFAYILWISVFSISQMLMTNTIEEKSSRVIEVLLSSVSPLQLMAGKISGIALTGVTMVGSWALCLVLIAKYLPAALGTSLNVDLEAIIRDPAFLASFLVYFVLGYMFYAALLVAIGAACDTLKEAQNLMGPISVVLMIPLLAIVFIAKDPNSKLAMVMSFIPPFTPFVMMNRAAGPPAPWEYVATTIVLAISIAIVMWIAAKVFRVGILMSGKAPTLKDILRWVRTPVGQVPVRETPPEPDAEGKLP